MLYSIIPPALVVLSLFGIIIILVKKAPAVARMESRLASGEESKVRRKFFWLEKTARGVLLFPEKIGKGLRFVFVKLIVTIIRRSKKKTERKIEREDFSKSDGNARKNQTNFKRNVIPAEKNDLAIKIKRSKRNERIQGKKDAFEKILIERIALNPKDVEAYERLGEYYMEIENWNYSKECFKQVLKLSPDNENIKDKMKKLEGILSGK